MAYIVVRPTLVKWIRRSLRLDSALDEDLAYTFTDEEVEDIIRYVLNSIDPIYTLEDFPKEKEALVILLVKKEVYWRLATATAPLYPLQAEGAGLQQNVRFDHYSELISKVNAEIESGKYTFIEVGQVFLSDKYYTQRNYSFAKAPKIELITDNVYTDMVELSWSKFNPELGKFYEYRLYIDEKAIIDEYADRVISPSAKNLVALRDIHRAKFRITGLKPSTDYFILIESKDWNSLSGYSEVQITTLA